MQVERLQKLKSEEAVIYAEMATRLCKSIGRGDVLDKENLEKLKALNNKKVMECVLEAIKICRPQKVTVITGSASDIEYLKKKAIINGEEKNLKNNDHTVHFDGPDDQGRDKANTRYLVSEDPEWGININSINREKGLSEIASIANGAMRGKEMFVSFFSLAPKKSKFSIPAIQITDSAYVMNSALTLYREGYEEFEKLNGAENFFSFMHSTGKLEDGRVIDVSNRRTYTDLENQKAYSVDTLYLGNSAGLKKTAHRLAIQKAHREGWLSEHMFITGVHGKPGRTTYFAGAFPSGCGKTSTAMIPGNTIIGDDLAYLRVIDGKVRAANPESGMFGIIKDVNPKDDPIIFKTITNAKRVIYSNVLHDREGNPYWLGMGREFPEIGTGYLGTWKIGMKENDAAHKNARFTIKLNEFENADPRIDDPHGVELKGIFYGGRDSDTTVPIAEALSWSHGVLIGASIESETTSATIGQEGVRQHDPMANLDFITVPLGVYIDNHLKFVQNIDSPPRIYSTNYFLKGENNNYYNDKTDKKIWILWAEGRVNNEFDAIETPIGKIPKYDDLKVLFREHFNREYMLDDYIAQFSIRAAKYLEKMDRMVKVYKNIKVPQRFIDELESQIKRLENARENYGDIISPLEIK